MTQVGQEHRPVEQAAPLHAPDSAAPTGPGAAGEGPPAPALPAAAAAASATLPTRQRAPVPAGEDAPVPATEAAALPTRQRAPVPAGEDAPVPARDGAPVLAGEGLPLSARPGAPVPARLGAPVRIEPGTLMEKLIPLNLVEPYLTGLRSVIAGFAYRAVDAAFPGPAWLLEPPEVPAADAGPAADAPDFWVLRWHALEMQTYLAPRPPGDTPRQQHGEAGLAETSRAAFELFIEPGPIPVGTEMYRVTPTGEEFFARHDGQAWLRPTPEG